jgi:hypothetical protein
MRRLVTLTLLLISTPTFAQNKDKLTDEQKVQRREELRAAFPKLEAEYLAKVAAAKAELAKAKAKFDADKDAKAYQAAIHQYHWAITGNAALGPIGKALVDLRDTHIEYDDQGKQKRGQSKAYSKEGVDGIHWVERNVWANMVDPVVPPAKIDPSYLKKRGPIKVLVAGDSLTGYMDPGNTMVNHLDDRFEILDQGLAGHGIASWFTSKSTPATLRWGPDVIVIMLGTNGTATAMNDDGKRNHRDDAQAQYEKDLLWLRDLPSKPQVIVVTVPAQGCAMSHFAVPAMSELQADIARRNGFGLIDMSRGLGGLMGDVPTAWTYCPNRKAVGKWIHSTDDAHANTGPSMAKYYGLIARQLLEPSKWYELNLTCSAVDDPAWKEPWLLGQCQRDPGESPMPARGFQKKAKDDGDYEIVPHERKIGRPKANGEVSFLRPKTGGAFYLMPGRSHEIAFGRPYQIESDVPPKDATFPAEFAVTGTILRGDGQPAAKIDVSLGDIKATTDDRGRFRFERLAGNLVDMPFSIAPLP